MGIFSVERYCILVSNMRLSDFPNRALVSSRTPNGTFPILFLV